MNTATWKIDRNPILRLDGEWEFYWNALLEPKDFHGGIKPELTGYMKVPSLWNGQVLQGKELPVFGCATYRLVLEGIPALDVLGITRKNARFSSKVYVNDRELLSDGNTSQNPEYYRSGNSPQTAFFSCTGSRLEILVQVSNYEFINSGIPISIELGTKDAIFESQKRDFIFPFFVLIVLGLISLMNLIFFLVALALERRETMLLLFSIFCFIIAVGTGLTNQRPLLLLLPDIPFTMAFKIKDFFLSAVFLMLFFIFYKYRAGIIPSQLLRWLSAGCGIYLTAILVLPIRFYYLAIPVVMVCAVVFLFLLLVNVGAWFIQKSEGLLLFIAILAFNLYNINILLFTEGIKADSSSGQIYILIFALIMFTLLSVQYYDTMLSWKQSVQRTQDAEMAFLRAQINPHFLYNALNSIAALCREAPDRAENAVVELSQYLRCSFDFKRLDSMTTLERELELLDAYLYIERIRFGDRLQVEYDVEDGLNFSLPTLILQPLVENEVRHGIMENKAGGTVFISIKRKGEKAIITVKDNGIGMEREKLELLLEEETEMGGIGIWNINRRLKMLYGQGMDISSEKNKGTKVSFSLPLSGNKRTQKDRGAKNESYYCG